MVIQILVFVVTILLLYVIVFVFNDFRVPKKDGLLRKKRIMGIFAHPDDETMISGTLLKCSKNPDTGTYLLSLTKGEASRIFNKKLLMNGDMAKTREREFKKVTKLLGVKDSFILDFKDQKLEKEDDKKLLKTILKYIRKVNPDAIITWCPNGFTFNPDHIRTNVIVTKAFEIFRKEKIETKLFYITVPKIVHRGTIGRTGFKESEIYYSPNMRVNIFGYTLKKYEILKEHRSQIPILQKHVKIPLWLLIFSFNEYYYEVC